MERSVRVPLSLSGMLASPYVPLVLAALLWSGNFIVGRAIRDEIPPLMLNFWRFFLAFLMLMPICGRELWASRADVAKNWKIMGLLALTGVTAYHSFVYFAVASTTAINAVLFLSTVPVVIIVVSWLLNKDKVTLRQGLGIGLSMLGAVVVICRGDVETLLHLGLNRGDLWMVIAVPTWALYCVLLKRRPPELGAMVFIAATMGIGVAMQVPLVIGELAAGYRMSFGIGSLAALAYVSFFASVLAYICWNRGTAAVGPNRAGAFLHLMPIFAAFQAIIFLGESLALYHIGGAALVALGIITTSSASVGRR